MERQPEPAIIVAGRDQPEPFIALEAHVVVSDNPRRTGDARAPQGPEIGCPIESMLHKYYKILRKIREKKLLFFMRQTHGVVPACGLRDKTKAQIYRKKTTVYGLMWRLGQRLAESGRLAYNCWLFATISSGADFFATIPALKLMAFVHDKHKVA